MTGAADSDERRRPQRTLAISLGVGGLAGLALAYELTLIRLQAWLAHPQFAAMILSLALLGYALSGTLLSRLRRISAGWIVLAATLFAVLLPVAPLLAGGVPFNGPELVWDWRQWVYLAVEFAALSLPFLAVALAIGLVLLAFPRRLASNYGADLAGAGLGAAAAVLLLDRLSLPATALALGLGGALPVVLLAWGLRRNRAGWLGVLAIGLASLVAWPGLERLQPGEHKPVSRTLAARGAERLARDHGLLGVLTLVANEQIPFRSAPGLSLFSRALPPAQLGLFRDGTDPAAIDPPGSQRAYLGALASALPYSVARPGTVLLLHLGGGQGLSQALLFEPDAVTIVEPDVRLPRLVSRFGPAAPPDSVIVRSELPRHYLARPGPAFDLIVRDSTLAPFRARGMGGEDYLLSLEGLGSAWQRLAPGGMLALTVPLEVPPRAGAKLLVTLAQSLAGAGVDKPLGHLAVVRSMNTVTLLAGREPLTSTSQAAIAAFADERGFDLAWLPEHSAPQIQAVAWEERWLARVAAALANTGEPPADYPFRIESATDDRPYFDHFFRFSLLPTLWSQRGEGGLAVIELDYLLLVATLVVAAGFGTLVLVLPVLPGVRTFPSARMGSWSFYFAAVGLAFMLVEIAFIQKLHLLFATPVETLAVALAGFLVFTGLGARLFARDRRWLRLAVAGIVIGCLAAGLLAEPVTQLATGWAAGWRCALALAMIAPIAVLMGVPFPVGLGVASARDLRLAGWAWGINGCASVVAAPAAVLLAHHIGFRGVLVLAAALYLAAGFCFCLRLPQGAGSS